MSPQHDVSDREPGSNGYTVREFRTSDRDAYLALFETVFGETHGPDWFEWKYQENPYTDYIPIFVAEQNGDIVGARSFFALELLVNGEPHLALEPSDTMVHPDHRGRGLLPRMTTAAIETYTESDASLCFNFPNDITLPHNLRHGWETVDTIPTYYRIHDLQALVSQNTEAAWPSVAGRLGNPVVSGYYRLAELRSNPDSDHTVRSHKSVPVATFSALGNRGQEDVIEAHKDAQFYRWRFDNPDWEYRAYTASSKDEPVAGIVVGESIDGGVSTAKITDLVPASGTAPTDALASILSRVIRDYGETAILVAPPSLPLSVLKAFGFRIDDRPPLSAVSDQTTHVARSLTGEWVIEGLDIRNGDSWNMTFVERDAS